MHCTKLPVTHVCAAAVYRMMGVTGPEAPRYPKLHAPDDDKIAEASAANASHPTE